MSKWKDISGVLANATVKNAEQVGGYGVDRLFVSGRKFIDASELSNTLTRSSGTSGVTQAGWNDLLIQIGSGISQVSCSNFEILVDYHANSAIRFRRQVDANRYQGDAWSQFVTSENVASFIKSYLDSNGYKPA